MECLNPGDATRRNVKGLALAGHCRPLPVVLFAGTAFRENRPMGLELPEDLAITYATGQASQLTHNYGQKSVAGIISTFLA
jgi:hypothetical protein